MELSRLLAALHPRLVPFPIVLLLTGLLLDASGLLFGSRRAHWAGRILTIAGTVSLLLAFVCGICAEIWAGRAGVPHQQIKWHELVATAAAWGFIVLTSWRLCLDGRRSASMTAYVMIGLLFYGLIAVAGYLGGELVTDYGAAVSGARADTMLSLHDLNTLAQRQTDRNVEYSGTMHHVAGAFVLVLTVTILIRSRWPQRAEATRWVGPTLLLCGGVLLFFTADLDLYALTDWRQFHDREVQAHKLIALILMVVGVRGLLKRAPISEPSEAQVQFQDRLVAVLALVGGGLLFTHVHTVAPYANVAAGVYISHIVMGLVALAIGAVKMREAISPRLARAPALVFPALMLVESFLLLTYAEGLPWFIGYGPHKRSGPHSNCIAPLGNARAELAYDPKTAQMDVWIWERFDDHPIRVSASEIVAVVSQGYQRTAVPLAAVDPVNASAAHFRGHAAFLRDATYLTASVELPLDGSWRSGDFDPWVVPAIAGIPPNQVARFVCPMHDGIRSSSPGDCHLCGMSLVPIQAAMSRDLHDPRFAMQLTSSPDPIPAQPVTLTLNPQSAESHQTLRDLQIVHEHRLHLIIVSDDLSFFDHVHPALQDDGTFQIDYTFPNEGEYLLFADIMPRGERSQVFRLPIQVGASRHSSPPALRAMPAGAREVGPYHIELIQQPREPVAGREVQLGFRLSLDGKPVTDLQPYIGAMGHCVIISEDTNTYLHCHPVTFAAAPPPEQRAGPMISFHTVFPRAGRYKVWGQFKRNDQVIVAGFVIEVSNPIVPKWLTDFLLFD